MLTIHDIIDKRKRLWQAYLDGKQPNQDEEYINNAARWILGSPSIMTEVREKPYLLIEAVLTVVDKGKKTVPFFLNEVQKDFIRQMEKHGKGRPYAILKGRQQGFTTLITAIQLCNAIVSRNFSGFTLANADDNTKSIFNDKARVVYDRLPDILKPHEKFNSKKELFFDKLNSSWRIATATRDVGRSKTLNFIHYSEVAFFEVSLSDLQSSIGETATADCFSVYETTANGYNEFKDLWDKGSCINLFYEWWRTAEYRSTDYVFLEKNKADEWLQERLKLLAEKGLDKEQITWYAKKYDSYIDKDKIKQEYPISAQEAFLSSGECVFDKDKVANQYERVKDLKPLKTGYFKYKKEHKIINGFSDEIAAEEVVLKDIEWVDDVNGFIKIHEKEYIKEQVVNKNTTDILYPEALSQLFRSNVEDYLHDVIDGEDPFLADWLYNYNKEFSERDIILTTGGGRTAYLVTVRVVDSETKDVEDLQKALSLLLTKVSDTKVLLHYLESEDINIDDPQIAEYFNKLIGKN